MEPRFAAAVWRVTKAKICNWCRVTDPRAFVIARNRHGLYCVPSASRDRPASRTILGGNVWEAQTLEFIRRHCGDGDVVHAGAYFGDFLPALEKSIAHGALVWAFEPNPENFSAATETRRLNALAKIELRNCALGAESGPARLQIKAAGRALGGGSTLMAGAASDESALIQLCKVDDVVPRMRKVTILQLDVEGAEAAALSGAIETIRKWRPILILETVPQAWVDGHLTDMGYRVWGRCNENTVLAVTPVVIRKWWLARLAGRVLAPLFRFGRALCSGQEQL